MMSFPLTCCSRTCTALSPSSATSSELYPRTASKLACSSCAWYVPLDFHNSMCCGNGTTATTCTLTPPTLSSNFLRGAGCVSVDSSTRRRRGRGFCLRNRSTATCIGTPVLALFSHAPKTVFTSTPPPSTHARSRAVVPVSFIRTAHRSSLWRHARRLLRMEVLPEPTGPVRMRACIGEPSADMVMRARLGAITERRCGGLVLMVPYSLQRSNGVHQTNRPTGEESKSLFTASDGVSASLD
mmetsp:Transcript_16473/g.47373  ORF Transcript_16473/g.47373 Transcript_16473/m.47373 type:complete len:241 (-) Transcript_16473:236-958(-)